MRSTIKFDTNEYIEELKRGGFEEKEAKSLMEATKRALNEWSDISDLATKKDIKNSKEELIKYIHNSMWQTIVILSTLMAIFSGLMHYFGK